MTKKLSICMIVKDEENNLRRCLDSLLPLLEGNHAELIIVDTGSTDQTVELAKEYTDNVYFHQWNGNFSDMRNISMSYAKGQWIFIIDADEELETPNELLYLFESNKINNYNTIRIREKNLLSIKLNKYVYHYQERIFKNSGTFQYKGTVHNQPIYQQPVLTVHDIQLMHYGYINEDKDLMEKKFQRTANMLKKELEGDSEHVYYRFQLARSYMMHGDSEIAIEEIKKAYESMKKQDKRLIPHRYYVFGEYARMALHTNQFEQVINICIEGLSYNKNYLDLYYYLGHAYLSLEENSKGIEMLNRYIELNIQYKTNELDLSNFTAVEMYSLDKTALERTLDRVVSLVYKESEINEDIGLYKLFLNEIKDIDSALKVKLLTKIFIVEKNDSDLFDLYKNIEEDQRYPFINYFEMLKKDFDLEEKELIENTFSISEDDYGLLNKIRVTSNRKKLLTDFINNYDIIKFTDELIIEFVTYLMDYHYVIKYFKKIDSLTIKKIVKVLIEDEVSKKYFLESLNRDFGFNDFQHNRVYIAIANVLLLSEIEDRKNNKEKSISNLKEIFYLYLDKGIATIQYIFNMDRIRLIYNTHENKEEKFLMIMYLYSFQRDLGNKELAIKYLKEAGIEYPYFASLLTFLIQEIKADFQVIDVMESINKVKSQKENLNILHGTIEIANQMNTLVKAQNQLSGVTATGVNYYPSYLSYDSSHTVDIDKVKNKDKVIKDLYEAANSAFDVFHFHYNTSIMPNLMDLPLLKENTKKVFMHHWGTDVRRLSIAKKINSYAKSKNENEEQVIKQLNFLGNYIDDCIVGDAELYEYVKGFYKRVHIVRQALDLSEYLPNYEFKHRKDKPVIVHAPTSSDFKGTKLINAAIEKLQLQYNFEYKLVQNMSHEQVKLIYQDADIIIDQLHSAGHGLLSLEVMAMEKPVICSISEFMKDFYPKEIPIYTANPDNIEQKIEQLIKDYELRIYLGKQGRSYVEQYHDHTKIAKDLITIYNSI